MDYHHQQRLSISKAHFIGDDAKEPGCPMTGNGYRETKSTTFQSVGFTPESRNRPVEDRVICSSGRKTTALPPKAGVFDRVEKSRLVTQRV